MLTVTFFVCLFLIQFLKADPCLDTCIQRCVGYHRVNCGPRLDAISGLNYCQCEQACQNYTACRMAEYGYGLCRLYACSEIEALDGYQVFRKCDTVSTASTIVTTIASSSGLSTILSTSFTKQSDKCMDTCIERCDGYRRGNCGPSLQAISGLNSGQCEQACQNITTCKMAEYGYSLCRLYNCSTVQVQNGYQVFRKCNTVSLANTLVTTTTTFSRISTIPATSFITQFSLTPSLLVPGTSTALASLYPPNANISPPTSTANLSSLLKPESSDTAFKSTRTAATKIPMNAFTNNIHNYYRNATITMSRFTSVLASKSFESHFVATNLSSTTSSSLSSQKASTNTRTSMANIPQSLASVFSTFSLITTNAATATASTSPTSAQKFSSSTTTSTTNLTQISSSVSTEKSIFARKASTSIILPISIKRSPASTTIFLTSVLSIRASSRINGTSDTITLAKGLSPKLAPNASINTMNDITSAGASMSTANMESKSFTRVLVSKLISMTNLSKELTSRKHTYNHTLSSLSKEVWPSGTEQQPKSLKNRFIFNTPTYKRCCAVSIESVSVLHFIVGYIWWFFGVIERI